MGRRLRVAQQEAIAKRKLNKLLRTDATSETELKVGDMVHVFMRTDNEKRGIWSQPKVDLSYCIPSGTATGSYAVCQYRHWKYLLCSLYALMRGDGEKVKCSRVADSFTSNSSATIYIYTVFVSDKTHLKPRDLALCSRNDGAALIVHGLLQKDIFQAV